MNGTSNLIFKQAYNMKGHFSQRRHADGHQVHEKVLSITHHQGNANQNHKVIPSLNSCQKDMIRSVGEDVEKQEHWCTAGGNVNKNVDGSQSKYTE